MTPSRKYNEKDLIRFAANNDLENVKYIREELKIGRYLIDAMAEAAKQGHFRIVEYLHKDKKITNSYNALYNACKYDRLDIVKFFSRKDMIHFETLDKYFCAAILNNAISIKNYFMEHLKKRKQGSVNLFQTMEASIKMGTLEEFKTLLDRAYIKYCSTYGKIWYEYRGNEMYKIIGKKFLVCAIINKKDDIINFIINKWTELNCSIEVFPSDVIEIFNNHYDHLLEEMVSNDNFILKLKLNNDLISIIQIVEILSVVDNYNVIRPLILILKDKIKLTLKENNFELMSAIFSNNDEKSNQ